MIDSYITVRESTSHKLTRKKSRFIALLSPASSHEGVQQQMAVIRKTYHDATHHCSAFRLLIDDIVVEASSDDGEPAGAAGLPMLHQLAGKDLCNVLAVVVRYYGGTNLGVGGLVRAYSDSVSEAIEQAVITTQSLLAHIAIRFPVEVNSIVMSAVHRFSAHIETLVYDAPVRMEITLPPSQVETFRAVITEATGARMELEVTS